MRLVALGTLLLCSCTQVRAVLFDVGGVLSKDMIETKLRDLARRHRLPEEQLVRSGLALRQQADLGKLGDAEYWRAVLRRAGVAPSAEDTAIERYLEPVPGTLELARRLRAAGLRVGILSNDTADMAGARRRKLGYGDLFDPIIISAEVGQTKPGRAIFDHAVRLLGLPASQVLFVDNSEENVQGARRAGLRAIRFVDAAALEAELKRMRLLH